MAGQRKVAAVVSGAMAAVLSLGLAGCSALQVQGGGAGVDGPLTVSGVHGSLHGGQQPVTGATLQLYAVGMTGYGSAATPLLPTSGVGVVKTQANGFFTLPSYTCPSGSLVYLTGSGGNPQLMPTAGADNPALALVAALGDCATLKANAATTFIQINEVTTVAAVWALQQFIGITAGTPLSSAPGGGATTPSFTVGTSATNLQGLINAFATASVLADVTTGLSPGHNASGTQTGVENWQVNTVADILASCVNSDPVGGGTGCSNLFSATTVGASVPADTLQAALLIARNPGNNVQNIFQLAAAIQPFQPVDNFINDFTIGYAVLPNANYGVDLGTSSYVSIDGYGNAWVASSNVTTSPATPTPAYNQKEFITEFDPTGNLIGSPIYQYNTGTVAAPTIVATQASVTGNGSTKNQPFVVYIDPSNNAWTTDPGGSATVGAIIRIPGSTSAGGANGGGTPANVLAIPAASGAKPGGVAIDPSGNVYVSLLGSTTAPGYSATFGSATTGVVAITPTGTSAGPLGGAVMLPNNLAATTQADYLVVDNTPTATYAAAPFLDVITQTSCGTATGAFAQYFIGPTATVTGSSSSTTATNDTLTPLNLISNNPANATCAARKSSIADIATTFNSTTGTLGSGTAVTLPALALPLGSAVDATGNLWTINTSYQVANYPLYGLIKTTPGYAASPTTGALTATLSATAVNGGGLPYSTTPEYLAIDGAGNVWTTGQQTQSITTVGVSSSGGANGSHYEWDNNGNPLSPSGKTVIRTGTTGSPAGPYYSSGWYGGNTGSSTQRTGQTRRGIAIDLSGNVWTTDAGSQGKTLFILVGAAAPVVTPLSLGKPGVRP